MPWDGNRPTLDSGRRENMRKLGIGIAVLFVLFYVITQPAGAAGAVRGAADALTVAFESLIDFFAALFR